MPRPLMSPHEYYFASPIDAAVRSATDTITDFFSSDGLTYCVVAMFIKPLETNDGLIYVAYSLKNGSVRPGDWTRLSRSISASVNSLMKKSADTVPVGLVLSSFDTKKYLDVTRKWMANTKTREGFNHKMAILGKKLVSGATGEDASKDLVSPWAHPYFIRTLSLYLDSSLAVTIGGKAFSSGREVPANSHRVFGDMIKALTPAGVGRVRFNTFKDGIDEEKDMLLSERRATENISANNKNSPRGRKRKRRQVAAEEKDTSPNWRRIPSFVINIAPGHGAPELEAAFPKTFVYTKSPATAVVNETK